MYSDFNSKAKTLLYLKKNYNEYLNIPDLLVFEKDQILKTKNSVIKKIQKKFLSKKIIIRSSAKDEDQENYSNAGKYDSAVVNNLKYRNIYDGLNKVIKKLKSNKDKIIIQLFIYKPNISGVIFTRDINTNAPYYVINFDRSGKTNLVTSGRKNISQKTLNILKNYKKIPKEFIKLVETIKFIERKLHNNRLDIEFAIKNKKVFIFQVRPLKKNNSVDDKIFFESIVNLEKKIKKILYVDKNLSGSKSLLSNMSDWNPAEMIGAKSTTLSLSLYAELITNEIWRLQRKNYGYKNLDPYRLMIDLAGSPFIDLRIDLNSFLPINLAHNIQEKSINHFLKQIYKNQSLHDKIEFEVIPTCYTFTSHKYLDHLGPKEKNLYNEELRKITNNVINSNNSEFVNDTQKIKMLIPKLENLNKSKISIIQKIFFIIDITKKFGTLPFAGIARSAFISTVLLKDLVKINLLKQEDVERFYSTINTITNEFNSDLYKLKNKKITRNKFLKKYGHLRPSTYSISSENYKDGYENYFSSKSNLKLMKQKKFHISKKRILKINKNLKKHKLKFNFKQLINFASRSIYLREYSKFIFTKGIDEIFNSMKKLAFEVGIKYQDLEHVSIKTFTEAYNNLSVNKFKSVLLNEIRLNKRSFKISKGIKLPDVIKDFKDVNFHYETNINANYITSQSIIGKIKIINKKNILQKNLNLDDYIIFIENADPGYDFIFTYNIKGLVTQYGGANSHMAIRCMELNIPAAIGLGEKKYNFYSIKNKIELNCEKKTINTLS